MNFDLMRSLLIDRALRGELFSYSNSIAAEEKSLNEEKETPFTIPNNWQWKHVADCVQFNPKVIQDDAAEVSFIPMADVEPGFVDHCSTRQIKLWAKVKKGFSRFQEGDLLVAKITPCFQNRKSCIAKNLISGTGAGSTEFHVIRCVSDVDAKFLLYFFKSEYFIRYGVNHFNGTVGQQRVGAQDIKDCLIPVPPFDEQTRIVEKLEEAFDEIDRAEKAYDELQTLAGVLRGQILQEAIQGKLVPQSDSEPVVEQIGEVTSRIPFTIPEKWKWVQLKSVGQIVGGGTPKTSVADYWGDEISWVTPADLGKNSSKWIHSGAKSITRKGLDESSAKLMPEGSVVYSSRAPIGHIAIAGQELCTNQGCKSFVPNTDLITTEWAYYMLIARTKDIQSRASGTTFKEISGKGMGETWIALPPPGEQQRIVTKIEDLLNLVDALTA